MQFVIYGTAPSGKVTINADGHRCVLTKQEDGTWKPSRPSALAEIQKLMGDNLGVLVPQLFGPKGVVR